MIIEIPLGEAKWLAKWLNGCRAQTPVQQRSVASVFSVRLILPPSFASGTNQVNDHHLVVSEMQQFFKDKLMVSETSIGYPIQRKYMDVACVVGRWSDKMPVCLFSILCSSRSGLALQFSHTSLQNTAGQLDPPIFTHHRS